MNLVHNQIMSEVTLNIHEAKTHLSRHLSKMKEEDRIILCNRNKPVAEVRLLPLAKQSKRQLGLAKGEFTIPDSFWAPSMWLKLSVPDKA